MRVKCKEPTLPSPTEHEGLSRLLGLLISRLRLPLLFAHGEYEESASAFVEHHEATEAQHLAAFDLILNAGGGDRSRLLPVWRGAGFSLGAVSVLWCTR